MPLLSVARRILLYPSRTTERGPTWSDRRTSFSDRTWRTHVLSASMCLRQTAGLALTQPPLLAWFCPRRSFLPHQPLYRSSPTRRKRYSVSTMGVSSVGDLMLGIVLVSAPTGSRTSTNVSRLPWPKRSAMSGAVWCSPDTPLRQSSARSMLTILTITFLALCWGVAARSLHRMVITSFFFGLLCFSCSMHCFKVWRSVILPTTITTSHNHVGFRTTRTIYFAPHR
jgi:hypothetical protein